jgi:hypothetical protein
MAIGTVVFVSRNGGMIVVQHDQGFTLAELLGGEGEIERGDRLRGDWMSLGGDSLYKGGDEYDAVIQNIYGRVDAAVMAARRMGGG